MFRIADAHRGVVAVIAALVAAAVVALALPSGPLAAAIARKRDDVAQTSVLLDLARKGIADNQSLARAVPASNAAEIRAAATRILAQHGLQPAPSDPAQDGAYRVVIANARFDDVVRAVDALAHEGALFLVEGTFTALVDAGRVRADLTFAR
jgi:type II secretory pathway component PulM